MMLIGELRVEAGSFRSQSSKLSHNCTARKRLELLNVCAQAARASLHVACSALLGILHWILRRQLEVRRT